MQSRVVMISLLALAAVASAKSSVVVIDKGHTTGEELFGLLCNQEQGRQLSKLSSIKLLNGYVNSLDDGSATAEQLACRNLYQEPLMDLENIINNDESVCSSEYVSLIEDFHQRYMDSTQSTIPQPLKLFFVHYAMGISNICKDNLAENIGIATEGTDLQYNTIFGGSKSEIVEWVQRNLMSEAKDYSDFQLPWSTVDAYNSKHGESSASGSAIFKAGDATTVKNLQSECIKELSPIYSSTTLPVMRLINLGYNRQGSDSFEQLGEQAKLVQNWYNIAQACEDLLPIKLYEDKTSGQAVLITPEEAEKLGQPMNSDIANESVITVPLPPIKLGNFLRSVLIEEPNKLIELVESNHKEREDAAVEVLRKAIANARA